MRISAKGRYGLAAMIDLAKTGSKDEYITIISIAEKLGISKIYLEQVFALLKKSGLVKSTKGSNGGYQLTKKPNDITAYDIINAIEQSLFEKNEQSLSNDVQNIEKAMTSLVFDQIDNAITEALKKVSLSDLVAKADFYNDEPSLMFYI